MIQQVPYVLLALEESIGIRNNFKVALHAQVVNILMVLHHMNVWNVQKEHTAHNLWQVAIVHVKYVHLDNMQMEMDLVNVNNVKRYLWFDDTTVRFKICPFFWGKVTPYTKR